jgi:hypothetical protein
MGPQECLAIQKEGSQRWSHFYTEIEDFDPKPGMKYVIRIHTEPVENPPADRSSLKYILDEILEEREVISLDGVVNDVFGVVELYGESVSVDPSVIIELKGQKNRVSGTSGCNSFFGDFWVMDSETRAIQFGNMGATEMWCEGQMEVEQLLFKALDEANSFQMERGEIRFFMGDNIILKARRID